MADTPYKSEGGLLICVRLTMVGFICVRTQWMKFITVYYSGNTMCMHTHTTPRIYLHKQVGVAATAEVTASMFSRPSLSAWTEYHSNPSLLLLHLSPLCNWSDTHWERNTLIAWFIQGPILPQLRFTKSASSACGCNSTRIPIWLKGIRIEHDFTMSFSHIKLLRTFHTTKPSLAY